MRNLANDSKIFFFCTVYVKLQKKKNKKKTNNGIMLYKLNLQWRLIQSRIGAEDYEIVLWYETEPISRYLLLAPTGHSVPEGTVMHKTAESKFMLSYAVIIHNSRLSTGSYRPHNVHTLQLNMVVTLCLSNDHLYQWFSTFLTPFWPPIVKNNIQRPLDFYSLWFTG